MIYKPMRFRRPKTFLTLRGARCRCVVTRCSWKLHRRRRRVTLLLQRVLLLHVCVAIPSVGHTMAAQLVYNNNLLTSSSENELNIFQSTHECRRAEISLNDRTPEETYRRHAPDAHSGHLSKLRLLPPLWQTQGDAVVVRSCCGALCSAPQEHHRVS